MTKRLALSLWLAVAALLAPASELIAQPSIRPLTLARLDQFIKGLEAEKAFWTPIWAKDKRMADSAAKAQSQVDERDPMDPTGFRKRQERYSACQDAIVGKDAEASRFTESIRTAMARLTPAQQQSFATEAGTVAMNVERAQAANDEARLPALYDQMANLYAKHLGLNAAQTASTLKRVQMAMNRECGRRPSQPTAAERDSALNAPSSAGEPLTLVSDTLTSDVGMRASGLGENYALLRELITMYLAAEEAGEPPTPDGFNAAERAVIKQRMARLKPLLEYLDSRGGLDF